MRGAALLVAALALVSQARPAGGSFKETCGRPSGACQAFCVESEVQIGKCRDGRPCCLPTAPRPAAPPAHRASPAWG